MKLIRKGIDLERFRIIFLQPGDSPCNLVALGASCVDSAQKPSYGAVKKKVVQFLFEQGLKDA